MHSFGHLQILREWVEWSTLPSNDAPMKYCSYVFGAKCVCDYVGISMYVYICRIYVYMFKYTSLYMHMRIRPTQYITCIWSCECGKIMTAPIVWQDHWSMFDFFVKWCLAAGAKTRSSYPNPPRWKTAKNSHRLKQSSACFLLCLGEIHGCEIPSCRLSAVSSHDMQLDCKRWRRISSNILATSEGLLRLKVCTAQTSIPF